MNWLEYVQTIEAYDVDVEAVEKYNESFTMYQNNAERAEFLQKGYDPDLINEFCYYPIEEWGNLIQWAINEYNDEVEYKGRLLRASLIMTGLDPEVVGYVQNPYSSNVLHDGQTLMDVYHLYNREHGTTYPFEYMKFGFNSFSGAINVIPPDYNEIPQDNMESSNDESNWIPMDAEETAEPFDLSHLFEPNFDEVEGQYEKFRREKEEREQREMEEMMELQRQEEERRQQQEWEEAQQRAMNIMIYGNDGF